MTYEEVRKKITQGYELYLESLTQEDYVDELLVAGLDRILKREFDLLEPEGITERNFSLLKQREISDDFQLTIKELTALRFSNPFERYDLDELRALYGRIGYRVFNSARVGVVQGFTLLQMKKRMIEYRRTGGSNRPNSFRNFGRKSAIAMEDYLIYKSDLAG